MFNAPNLVLAVLSDVEIIPASVISGIYYKLMNQKLAVGMS